MLTSFLQPRNAPAPMLVTLLPISTEVRAEQFANALSGMDVPLVITTVCRTVFGMKGIAVVGIETSVSAEQPVNALFPTLATVKPNTFKTEVPCEFL